MRRIAICISAVAALALAPLAHGAATLQITGGGWGHGIGMSQYGAYGYALHGEDYQFILAHYYQGTAISTVDPNQTVRVLIGTGKPSFSGASAIRSETTGAKSRKLAPADSYSLRALASGSLALYNQAGKKVAKLTPPLIVTGPAPMTLAGHGSYRGALEFRAVGSAVQTVDAVGLDDYVRGVVAAEMPASWAAAALEAQAVAARTYALTSNVNGNGYQLYPDTRSQMYGGVAAETPATDAAVAATSGQILTYHGAPATTFFFSSSGGYTENIENVWSGATPEPWLRGVPDPYDGVPGNPYHQWSYRMTLASARKKLGSLVKGKFRGIRVTKRGVSPRVISAVVVGSRGKTQVTGTQLETAFALPSTWMRFTTISSAKKKRPKLPRAALDHIFSVAVQAELRSHAEGLTGFVFPASKGSVLTAQRHVGKHWRTFKRLRAGVGGSYTLAITRSGTYRVMFAGAVGPTITIS
jgi:stage II sporulation protein D